MSVEEARALAQSAALQGRPALARDVAAALLRENKQDRTALIVLAAVEPQLGRPAQGRMAGTRAWRLSDTRAERYEAARLTAFAATREDRQTLAQFWLRRAAANAPTDAALAQTGSDFGRVRRLNPWNVQLSLDAAPSSNVNGGSSSTVNVIDGIPYVGTLSGDAQALSGWTYSGDAQVSYRLAASAEARTGLRFRLYGRGVALSDEAREIAPSSQNADFAAIYGAVSLDHDRRLDNGSWGIEGTLGGNWYGGELAYGFARVELDRQWREAGEPSWRLSGSYEHRWDDGGDTDSQILKLTGSGSQSVPLGALTYGFTLESVDAPSPNDRAVALRLSTGLTYENLIGPAQLSVSGGIEARHYPDYTFLIVPVPGGREDLRVWSSLSATFVDWSYAGFAPVLTLSGSATDSNVSRFERSELSLGISFRSTF